MTLESCTPPDDDWAHTAWHGFLVLDKPPIITSRTAVDMAAVWFPAETRLGHAGTLDPMATGVLVLCVGKATRLVEYVQQACKTYRAQVRLGMTSDTDDAEGVCTAEPNALEPKLPEIESCLDNFLGEILQTPPRFSAARVGGRRAYHLARRRQEFELAPRPVRIHQITIRSYAYPHLDLEVICGKGTYLRSLARDLGRKLGCGGLLEGLRRTRIGGFRVENAITLEADADTARRNLLPLVSGVSQLPKLELPEPLLTRLRLGQRLALADLPERVAFSGDYAVLDASGQLAAIAHQVPERDCLSPVKVFHDEK